MKSPYVQLSLIGLLTCLLCTACASRNKSTKLSSNPQSLRVVPVEGQRVQVQTTHLTSFMIGGLVGTAIEHAASSKGRSNLADRLNRDAKDFRPEVILAEECVALLHDSSAAWARGAVLYPESVVMPGGSKLLATETAPFKAGSKNHNKWLSVISRWSKGPPVAPASQSAASGAGALTLEVGHGWISLNHGDKLEINAYFRFLDSPSGNVVGARFVGHTYDVRPVTLESDPAAFVEDFRKIAHELAKEALTKLKVM